MQGALPAGFLLVIFETLSFANVSERAEEAQRLAAAGRYTEAQTLFETIRDEAQKTADPDYAAILNNLGAVYNELGRLRDAENSYERSLAVRHERGEIETRPVARTLNNLGMIYTELNMLSKAEETLTRAAVLHHKLSGGDDLGVAQAWLNLGAAYKVEKRWAEAEDMFRKALAVR